MRQTRYRVTDVAKALSRLIKADLSEPVSLEIIGREFPGISREELLRALALCEDDAALEYERSQELIASMRVTTAGYATLLALVDLWRSQSDEQRRAIGGANAEFANTLDNLQVEVATSSRLEGLELLANVTEPRSKRAQPSTNTEFGLFSARTGMRP